MTDEQMPVVPGYRFESKMAEGGMGVVYRAIDETLGRAVAVKMIRHGLLGPGDERTETVARFLREARAAAQIQSNHVSHVLQFGQTDSGDLFLVLEYLSGETLADVLRRDKRLNVQRAVRIMRQVCRGMDAAHRLGIVHRDLKPSNIMLIQQDGEPDFAKILDFGVAKVMGDQESGVTRSGMLVGTYTCMAPEQVNNDTIDARTDVYALAVMLFRMIAGRPLFAGNDFAVVLYHHVHTEAPLLSEAAGHVHIPDALNELVRRCLSKNPNERVQSMAEFDRLLGESVIGQTEMIAVESALVTEVQDVHGQGLSTLRDDLNPVEDEDEIFEDGSASAPHPGIHVEEQTQGADANQVTRTQARHEQTVSSDEAETRSASFQLRGYDVLTNTGGGASPSNPGVVTGPPAPPPPTSTGDVSHSNLQDRLRPMQNLLANSEVSGSHVSARPPKKSWIVPAAVCGIVVVGASIFLLSRPAPTPATSVNSAAPTLPSNAKPATASDDVKTPASPVEAKAAVPAVDVNANELRANQMAADAPAEAVSEKTKAVEETGASNTVKPDIAPAATPTSKSAKKSNAVTRPRAKSRTQKKRGKKQTKQTANSKGTATVSNPVSATKEAKPVAKPAAKPAAKPKPSRPSFIRVRTGNE